MTLDQLQTARAQLDRARLALDAGQRELAGQLLSDCLKLEPDMPDARRLQAQLALQSARSDRALAELDANEMHHPSMRDDPELVLLRAAALSESGQEGRAIDLLSRLAQRFEHDPRPHRMLAALSLKLNQPAAAITHLRRVVQVHASDTTAQRMLAQLVAESDADAGAQILLEQDPVDPVNRLAAARLHRSAGRLRDAEEMYRTLLDEQIEDAAVWYESGVLADELGAYDLARQRLTRAVHLGDADATDAPTALALCHMHAGQMRRACQCWLGRVRRRPQDALGWAGTLVCAVCIGRSTLSRRAQHVLKVHASRRERQHLMATMWRHAAMGVQLNRIDDGRYQYEPAQASPLRAMLKRAAAKLHHHGQKFADRADTHYHQAVCLNQLGRSTDADRTVHTALHINPRYRDAQQLALKLHEQRQAA